MVWDNGFDSDGSMSPCSDSSVDANFRDATTYYSPRGIFNTMLRSNDELDDIEYGLDLSRSFNYCK